MEHWIKFFECENGAVHLDVNADNRTNLQLVIAGEDLLSRLYRAQMIWLSYDQCLAPQFLLRGEHAELKQLTPTATYPATLPGVFYPQDFRRFFFQSLFDGNGTVIEIERQGSDLVLRNGYRQAGTRGHGHNGVYHQTYYFPKEYMLRNGRDLSLSQ